MIHTPLMPDDSGSDRRRQTAGKLGPRAGIEASVQRAMQRYDDADEPRWATAGLSPAPARRYPLAVTLERQEEAEGEVSRLPRAHRTLKSAVRSRSRPAPARAALRHGVWT